MKLGKIYTRYRIAGWVFGVCALLLCLINVLALVLLWGYRIGDVLSNCALPLAMAVAIYMLHWDEAICLEPKRWRKRWLMYPILWNCIVYCVATGMMMNHTSIDLPGIIVSIMPVFALCTLAYAYQNLTRAAVAISVTSLIFLVNCGILRDSTTPILTIIVATVALLLSFGKRDWIWRESAPMKRNWLAAVIYAVAALALLVTPLLARNLTFLDFSGSGFWNVDYVNDFCTQVFGQAKLFGSMNPEHGIEAYYQWRLTGILAGWGYVAWGAILAICALMLISGGILVTYRFQHRFYAVGAYVLLASQMVGYIIKCCGFEGFRTTHIMPLMTNDLATNLVYLVMVVLILPPQFCLISDTDDEEYLFDDEEDFLDDEEAADFEQLLNHLAMEEEENT